VKMSFISRSLPNYLLFPGPLVNGDRRVYFNALASVNEGWTLASILLNQTLLASHPSPTDLFRLSEFTRSSQSSNEVISAEGVMFFPLLKSNSLHCWKIWTEYKQENFVTLYTVSRFFLSTILLC
jgi:Major royal jelly protein.